MSDLLVLLKTDLARTFGFSRLSRRMKGRTIAFWSVVVLLLLLILGGITLYMWGFLMMMRDSQVPLVTVFQLATTIIVVICFATCIFRAGSYLFRTRDYELLMTLPIKTSSIVASKMLSLYIFEEFFALGIMLCTNIAFLFVAPFNIGYLLISLVAAILAPLLPVVVASFVSFLFGFIPLSDRAKNAVATVFYLLLIVGLMIMNISSSKTSMNFMIQTSQIDFLGRWVVEWMTGNGLSALFFLLATIIPAIIFVLVVGRFFLVINSIMTKSRTSKRFKLKNQKYRNSGEIRSIIKKEIKQLAGARSVLMNVLASPIMSILVPIVVLVTSPEIVTALNEKAGIAYNQIALMLALISALFLSITPLSAASISLEGKSFWILKTSPVSAKSVIIGKCTVSFVLTFSAALVQAVVLPLIAKADPYMIPLCLLLTATVVAGYTALGMFLNLAFPRFDVTPIKAIKQGKPVLLIMLIGLLFSALASVGSFFLAMSIGVVWAALIIFAFFALFAAASLALLFVKGTKMYDELSGQ